MTTMNHRRNRRRGFTLTEVLVAVPLLVLVFWIVSTIFTTTRDTVNLGMTHAKVTASAESAVQRMARDLMGLRMDGRMVITAWRVGDRPLNKDRATEDNLPGAFGDLSFVSQVTALSQFGAGQRANVARIQYRYADRQDFSGNPVLFWDNNVLMRQATLLVYDNNPATARLPTAPEIPTALAGATGDLFAFPQTIINLSTGQTVQPRTDLLYQAIESFRLSTYRGSATARIENTAGGFGIFPFSPTLVPVLYPFTTEANVAGKQAFYQSLLLPRSALAYNGAIAPPNAAGLTANRYPPGVPQVDPVTDVSLKDPGAAAPFQWYGRDTANQVDASGRPLQAWFPTAQDLPVGNSPPAAGAYYARRFMFIKDAEDQLEFNAQGTYAPLANVGIGGAGGALNRAPNAPAGDNRAVPWPEAVRCNMMIFDRVGRFRKGALYQAVIDLPGVR